MTRSLKRSTCRRYLRKALNICRIVSHRMTLPPCIAVLLCVGGDVSYIPGVCHSLASTESSEACRMNCMRSSLPWIRPACGERCASYTGTSALLIRQKKLRMTD